MHPLPDFADLPTLTTHTSGDRTFVTTGNQWETRYGYCRGLRVGRHIELTGTLGLEADGSLSGDAAREAERSFAILLAALKALGGSVDEVTRVTGYLDDVANLDAVGEVFRRVFSKTESTPCFTQVAVAQLAGGGKVELEMTAICGDR
ncbi:MAG: Rid family hydrolase [Planctomycetota bacterium]